LPSTRRSRVLQCPPERVADVVGDPYHLPRWWPKVQRVERVSAGRFTQVMRTAKGKPVRADFRLTTIDPERRYAWEQELEGTPFAGLLARACTEVTLSAAGAGETEVSIALVQKLRGWARFGPFLFRRAARVQLDEALEGLAGLCV